MPFVSGQGWYDGYPRSMWVAVYTSFVIWLVWMLLKFFLDGMRGRVREEQSTLNPDEPRGDKYTTTMLEKVKRSTKAARHLFFLLFSSTVITVLGYGASAGTSALLWIAFGVGVVWLLAELAIDSSWLREFLGWIIYPLLVIIWGLAFREPNR